MINVLPGYTPRHFFKKNNNMNTLKKIIKDATTTIVDVRSPWEFEIDHVPGAKNIPLEEFPAKIDEFRSINNPIVLYCRSGNRSGMAVNILKQNGINNAYNGGGLDELTFLLN